MATSPIAAFAESHGLSFAESADLPQQGSTLTREGGKLEGCATGTLPGGIEGTLARFTYVYKWTDSDSHTHEEDRPFTLVVTAIPESIGFAPYLGFSGPESKLDEDAGGTDMAPIEMKHLEALKGSAARAYKGISERWLAQLLSPALVEWLGRCDPDFGFELASGVLVAGRDGYLAEPSQLEALCTDVAHLATTIREESLEEVESGGEAEAARDPGFADPAAERALAAVSVDSPADMGSAQAAFAAHLRGSASVYLRALRTGLIAILLLNVPAVAIPILLIDAGEYVLLAAIEAALVLLVAVFSFRRRIRDGSKELAAEAFYRGYAADRKLTIEEPLHFVATHAEAKLAFKPDHVFSGALPGGLDGALALLGDGSKRSHRIATIAGPKGPVAEAELQSEAPGLSAQALDSYCESLVKEVTEDIATRSG